MADLTFHYRPMLRPASRCTLPEGLVWDYVELPRDSMFKRNLPRSRFPHGIIATDRELTQEELSTFDLQSVGPSGDPTSTPIKLFVEDDEPIDTTLELFLPQFGAKEAAEIRRQVVAERGVYIGGGGAAPAFAVHLDRGRSAA